MQCPFGIDVSWRRLVRGAIGQHERDGLAGADREFADRLQILAAQRHRGSQHHPLRPADRRDAALRQLLDPGDKRAIVEAQHKLDAHRHPPAQAAHQPHQIERPVPRPEEVGQLDGALVGLKGRRQHQRAVEIAPRDAGRGVGRCYQPAAVLRLAEECRKAGRRIKARQAQPIDRAVAPDQRRRRAIADQRVILDPLV